jgi:hypothetical protein
MPRVMAAFTSTMSTTPEVDVAGEERIVGEDHDVVSTRISVTGRRRRSAPVGDGSPWFHRQDDGADGHGGVGVMVAVSDPGRGDLHPGPSADAEAVEVGGVGGDRPDDPARPASDGRMACTRVPWS